MNKPDSSERRRFHRIAFNAPVELKAADHSWSVRLIDISLKGVLLEKPEGWPETPVENAEVELPLDAENTIRIPLKPTHVEPNRLGFTCTGLDLDSATLLRRLVELNLGDPELLERELEALVTLED